MSNDNLDGCHPTLPSRYDAGKDVKSNANAKEMLENGQVMNRMSRLLFKYALTGPVVLMCVTRAAGFSHWIG